MSTRVSPSASPTAFTSSALSKHNASLYPFSSNLALPRSSNFKAIRFPCERVSHTTGVRCNSSIWPGGPGSDEGDGRSILDAFFLGKAIAEAINERVESTVGEFLSAVGRLQAEQQKQVQDFQEEVLERAKKAKEKATREAKEAQGLIPKSAAETGGVTDSVASRTSYSATDPEAKVQSSAASGTYTEPAKEEEPAQTSSNDE